jgi:endonuclease/exonuclease/phosphatase family metal-dependent hydrolase
LAAQAFAWPRGRLPRVTIRALTWNIFHGRDFPPNAALFTTRSRLLRMTERDATHVQVNRSLREHFISLIATWEWDVALFQEFPPRWAERTARACGAEAHRVLTSRNSLAPLRAVATFLNTDLVGAYEGGSNLTLARADGRDRAIVERRELVLCPGPRPERRAMSFIRLADGVCVANLHASTGPANKDIAVEELRLGAERSVEWAAGAPLIFGGDLNVRPRERPIFDELAQRHELHAPTTPDAIDHLLVRGLEIVERPAAWPAEAREVPFADLRLRLSDHAPVSATFAAPTGDAPGANGVR